MDTRYVLMCFEQAAQPAFDRVARDRAQAEDTHTITFLRHLAMHLFDPDFSVRSMQRKLGIKDNNFSTAFGQHVGETPALYVKHRRLETAIRLLCVAGMTVSETSTVLGFRANGTFINAFRSYAQVTPGVFQERALRVVKVAANRDISWVELEEALGNDLSQQARNTFLQYLVTRYPHLEDVVPNTGAGAHAKQLRGLTIPMDLIDADVTRELPRAQMLWKEIQGCQLKAQVAVVKDRHTFTSPALFYLVREASRVIARDHREQGMELAKLALFCARMLESTRLDDPYGQYQALAWAWVGNLRALSLDFVGSEEVLTAAERLLPPGATTTRGEWCYWKAHLRWYERRLDEARILCDEAIALIAPAESLRLHCESRIFRGIVNLWDGKPRKSILDLDEALKWLDPGMFPVQCFSANYELTRCLLLNHEHERAAEQIELARSLNQRLHSTFYDALFRWLEGLVFLDTDRLSDAEIALVDARLKLLKIGRKEHAAVLALDLAVLYERIQQLDKAVLVAVDAVPMLKRLSEHGVQGIAQVLDVIEDAVQGGDHDRRKFEHVRETIRRSMQSAPSFVLDAKEGNHLLD